jgi:hypothetical protein
MNSRFNWNSTLLHYLLLPTPNNFRLPHIQSHRSLPEEEKKKELSSMNAKTSKRNIQINEIGKVIN